MDHADHLRHDLTGVFPSCRLPRCGGYIEFDRRYVLALTFSHPVAFRIASSAWRNLFRRPATVCLGPPSGMTLPIDTIT